PGLSAFPFFDPRAAAHVLRDLFTRAILNGWRFMRMSLRLILSLVVGVTLLSILLAVFQVRAEKRGLRKELENRAASVGETLEGKVEPWLNPPLQKRLQEAVSNFGYHQ